MILPSFMKLYKNVTKYLVLAFHSQPPHHATECRYQPLPAGDSVYVLALKLTI